MPKIVLHSGDNIECATFKVESNGVIYQTCPVGSANYHAHMGWVRLEDVSIINHDEVVITEADVTDDNA